MPEMLLIGKRRKLSVSFYTDEAFDISQALEERLLFTNGQLGREPGFMFEAELKLNCSSMCAFKPVEAPCRITLMASATKVSKRSVIPLDHSPTS